LFLLPLQLDIAEDFGRLGALQCTLRFIDRSLEPWNKPFSI
jgi:hypothetical protein